MNPNASVHILDDDATIPQTVRSALYPTTIQCKAYRTFADFEQQEINNAAGCLILDLQLNGERTSPLIKTLMGRPDFLMTIIVLTGQGTVPAVVEYMRLGAFDFLEKSIGPHLLLKTMEDALSFSTSRMAHKTERTRAEKLLASLTIRERQIASLVCDGHSSREIADRLDISVNTVANHRASALAKLEAQSRADLLRILQLTRGQFKADRLARPMIPARSGEGRMEHIEAVSIPSI